ncbi:MAG: hypothetical protein EHM61_21880, partial [Acidobacteria bacterium]
MRKTVLLFLACFVALGFGLCAERRWQRFYPDDPIWKEPLLMTKKPIDADRSEVIDFVENSSSRKPRGEIVPAANANTVGGVPDSGWFENRIGTGKMALSDAVRGPNQIEGPDMSRPWEIVEPKTEGITAGFKAKDGRGDTYFVKLDPRDYPQLTTSAEVISTKFF